MANASTRYGFKCIGNLASSDPPQMWEGKMTATTAIAVGDAIDHTSGRVVLGLATSDQLLGVAAQAIAVTNAADDPILFYPALPWYLFSGQCSGAYLASTDRYVACDITGGTGAMMVDATTNAKELITIVGEDSNDTIDADYTMVYFTILRSRIFQVLANA